LDVYKSYEKIKADNRIRLKPTNLIYSLYYDYLTFAISRFFRTCKKVSSKDLTQHTPFNQIEYKFLCDDGDIEFVLTNPSVPLENGLFYIGYAADSNSAYIEITPSNYSYNSTNNTLTVSGVSLKNGNILYISSYIIGEFSDTLDYDELLILCEAALIPYQEEQQNRNSLMNQRVTGLNQKQSSQAEHLKTLHNIVQDQEEKVKQLIITYSYSANANTSKGLGGVNT
jgi:hypothetical protein